VSERSLNVEQRFRGTPISSGIAIGRLYLYSRPESKTREFYLEAEQIDQEVDYYRKALWESRREIRQLSEQLQQEGALEGAAILDTHLQLMEEPALTSQIEAKIRDVRKNSAYLFQEAVTAYEERFKKLEDPYFRERVRDLQDVGRRVLNRLRQVQRTSLADLPPQSIVFAAELVPSETAEAATGRISAFVTVSGGDTSHSAIMAKARGIPFVGNVPLTDLHQYIGCTVIVDGRTGDVILNPLCNTISKYEELSRQLESHAQRFERLGRLAAETIDGYRIGLSANMEMFHEVELIKRYGGEGVGLFRTEYLCLARSTFPGEDEQYEIYRRIAEGLEGRPVVIRTFDIGGDKFNEFSRSHGEGNNPFLGCRAIRFMLKEHKAFKTQLRAILRASAHGDVRILFPMVSGLPELREAKAYVAEVVEELQQAGIPFKEDIQVGCMIEVPSAAITCDLLARECDFFSIGTNDLVQYSLAVDRSNQAMNYLYTPAHPAVIRLISLIVAEANRNRIPVTMCGEVAADPRFVPLLMGLGVHELSVNSRYLPIIKNVIRSTEVVAACRLAERVLQLNTPLEVLEVLIDEHRKICSSL
jgi:phosphoenolpyruvate-protein phosphotransferase (PTS system enzyme I)